MWTPYILPFFDCPSISWITSKRACSIWYARLFRLQHGADFVTPTHLFDPPLRTRAFPFGLRHLAPPAHQKVARTTQSWRQISWCAEQTPGGHSQEGPTSIWDLREFQVLHGVSEACRGAGFVPPQKPLSFFPTLFFQKKFQKKKKVKNSER